MDSPPRHPSAPTHARIPPSAPEVGPKQVGHSGATTLNFKRPPQGATGSVTGQGGGVAMLTGVPPPHSLPGAGRESSGQVRCGL